MTKIEDDDSTTGEPAPAASSGNQDSASSPRRKKRRKELNITQQDVVDESFVPSYERKTARGGYAATAGHRLKISQANKGKTPWNAGKTRSQADKDKIKAAVQARNRNILLANLEKIDMSEEDYAALRKRIKIMRENVRKYKSALSGSSKTTSISKNSVRFKVEKDCESSVRYQVALEAKRKLKLENIDNNNNDGDDDDKDDNDKDDDDDDYNKKPAPIILKEDPSTQPQNQSITSKPYGANSVANKSAVAFSLPGASPITTTTTTAITTPTTPTPAAVKAAQPPSQKLPLPETPFFYNIEHVPEIFRRDFEWTPHPVFAKEERVKKTPKNQATGSHAANQKNMPTEISAAVPTAVTAESLRNESKCPTGGPGGLICCPTCTATYCDFLTGTYHNLEEQKISKIAADLDTVTSYLRLNESRLNKSVRTAERQPPPATLGDT